MEETGIEIVVGNILSHFMNWKEDLRTSIKLFVPSPIHRYIQNFHTGYVPKRGLVSFYIRAWLSCSLPTWVGLFDPQDPKTDRLAESGSNGVMPHVSVAATIIGIVEGEINMFHPKN